MQPLKKLLQDSELSLEEWIVAVLRHPETEVLHRQCFMEILRQNPQATKQQLSEILCRPREAIHLSPEMTTIGFYGNVWIREQYYPVLGEHYLGHTHDHDHVSLVVHGGLMVHVDGQEPFEVWAKHHRKQAPSFFGVKAEHNHMLVPLVENTTAYCLFAYDEENARLVDAPKEFMDRVRFS